MSIFLGVDTGGTYTDAVLIRDEKDVIATAKSLTTREDLSLGIGRAIETVLSSSQIDPSQVSLASLSTTLATNALVEGHGGRVGLVLIGFKESDLEKHGLLAALKGDPYIVLSGGHTHAGSEKSKLDVPSLESWLSENDDLSGYAVAAQFATRNPEHEQIATEIVRSRTGATVSASHQLSAKLNGPKRALTAVLNARLIGMIDRLIQSAESKLASVGIHAPLMVVQGDGALISAELAREKPIETILSGPAASIVGARWMTGADTALVSDIGGTTTDVALLRNGRPEIDPAGAQVGPFRTMVEAVAMRTTGLGGDSEVHFVAEGLKGGVTLGPKRVVPVSLVAQENPDEVHKALDEQLLSTVPNEYDGRFVRRVMGQKQVTLSDRDQTVLDRITQTAQPLARVLKTRMETQSLQRLVTLGMIQVAGLTPSDACHVLGHADHWDAEAAEKAHLLFGRRRTGAGEILSSDPSHLAQMIVDRLTHQTGLALLETAFAEDNEFDAPPSDLAQHILMQKGLGNHSGLVAIKTGLNIPVIGLGASAPIYYPAVGTLMGCDMILPQHAGVANAIGAVVGRVTIREQGSVTSPSEGRYRVHLDDGPLDFSSETEALDHLEGVLTSKAVTKAEFAGGADIQVQSHRDIRKATAEAREVFVEGTITIEVSGRPRITR